MCVLLAFVFFFFLRSWWLTVKHLNNKWMDVTFEKSSDQHQERLQCMIHTRAFLWVQSSLRRGLLSDHWAAPRPAGDGINVRY